MYIVPTILILFAVIAVLPYLEKYMGKYKLPIYIIIGIILVVLAGTREVGIDPDSETYEYDFHNYYSTKAAAGVDLSYLFFSSILNIFTHDVHSIFLLYAFLGILLKFVAFRQLSEFWFLPIVIYMSFYYEVHEITQIRTGVLTSMFLLAIKPMAEGRKWRAALYLLIGAIFHISAIMLLPVLFLSNNDMSPKTRLFWALIVPAAYFFYFFGTSFIMNVDLPYIGYKLAAYQAAEEVGVSKVAVYVFSPFNFITIFLYYYLLFFYDTIIEKNKYFPLMIKIFGIGVFAYVAFAFLSIVAERVSFQYRVVTMLLYTNVIYTLKPKWAGILAVIFIGFAYLNYTIPYVFDVHLLWNNK